MLNKWINRIGSAACVWMAVLGMTIGTAADSGAMFSADAVIPGNQIDTGVTYFDLQMEPGQTQILTVRIDNPADQTLRASVETVTASTNRNGIIHYAGAGIYNDSLPHQISQLAVPEEPLIEVPPRSGKDAHIRVTMPEEPYEGMLLGAVRVTKQLGDDEPETETGIVNQYSYCIGLRLTETAADAPAEFSLGEVGMELVNHKAAIVAQIANPRPMIVRDISAHTQVFPSGQDVPVIAYRQEGIEMAPHSIFPMTLVDQGGYGFPAGEYTAQVELEQGGETWFFERGFVITDPDAEYVSANAVNQNPLAPAQSEEIPLLVGVVIFGLVAVICIGYLWKRKRRR